MIALRSVERCSRTRFTSFSDQLLNLGCSTYTLLQTVPLHLISSSHPRRNTLLLEYFGGQLASSITDFTSCYLKPLSPIFPTFDFFLYQCTVAQPGYQPLIRASGYRHPISIKGLAEIQMCLKPKVLVLKALRPSVAAKWIILILLFRSP